MITRETLLRSPEYWFEEAQNELFRQLTAYMKRENLTRTELAEKLGVTKGYVSQVMNGNFNYTLKKWIELSLSMDLAPRIDYQSLREILQKEENVELFSLPATADHVALDTATDSVASANVVGIDLFREVDTRMKAA